MKRNQTTEVRGLPDGFEVKVVNVYVPPDYLMKLDSRTQHYDPTIDLLRVTGDVILQKSQPSEIRFVEILDGSQDANKDYYLNYKWWREVKEEPYLKLSLGKCIELVRYGMMVDLPTQNEIREFVTENNS